MGTGTTAIACYNLKLNCIGSEISEAQVEYSKERLKQHIENSEVKYEKY